MLMARRVANCTGFLRLRIRPRRHYLGPWAIRVESSKATSGAAIGMLNRNPAVRARANLYARAPDWVLAASRLAPLAAPWL